MRILVTGGAGHIGSYLIRNIDKFLEVSDLVIVDSMITQRYASLFNLTCNPRITFIQKDVRELNIIEDDFLSEIDLVIHLAALTDATESLQNSEGLIENNLTSTENIAKICESLEIPLIFPSSTSIYSPSAKVSTVDENCKELAGNNPYALCKIMEEDYLKSLSQSLDFAILRFGTIYGASPGMRFHTAVNKFCFQAAVGNPITIWETALNQFRPYLYLDDAVRAIAHTTRNRLYGSEIYNVASDNTTVSNILNEISKYFDFEPRINLIKSEVMNDLSFKANTDKFTNTGFQFQGNITNGVNETLLLLNGLKRE